ncbi:MULTISPECIES: DUF4113 domain-containing protein [Shewanella]
MGRNQLTPHYTTKWRSVPNI